MMTGTTMTGKSTMTEEIFKHAEKIFDPPPATKVYCYGIDNDRVKNFKRYGIVHYGLPTFDFIDAWPKPLLLVLDDLLGDIDEKYMQELFTKKIHHNKLIVIFVTQNIYDKSIRVARNNCQYLILKRNPSNMQQIRTLGTQLCPGQLEYFMDAYHKATGGQYGYLFVDSHPGSNPTLRLRTDILPGQEQTVFVPAKVTSKTRQKI